MTSRTPTLGVVGILVLLVSIPGDVGAGREVPDFSGSWQLNEELSEDPRSKMRQRRESTGGGLGSGRGGMGRGSGMGDPEAMRDRMRRMEQGSKTLTILHVEPQMTIRTADDRERGLHTDGRKQGRTGGGGTGAEDRCDPRFPHPRSRVISGCRDGG